MELSYRYASIQEVDVYYKWANDPEVRKNSYHKGEILYSDHVKWFKSKLRDPNAFLYFFHAHEIPVGQVRIEINKTEAIIGICVDENYRGKFLSPDMLILASDNFHKIHPHRQITAYIKIENMASYRSFLKAGFKETEILQMHACKSYKLIK